MSSNPGEEKYKSRILSRDELFDILQREYVVCELRMRIYPNFVSEQILANNPAAISPSDYWKDTADKKKNKILNIAKKRGILSMFDNEFIKNRIVNEIIPESGFPNFIYKDDIHKFKQEKWDKHNYYSKQAEVKVYSSGKNVSGTIMYVDFPLNIAGVKIDGITKEIQLECITRVL